MSTLIVLDRDQTVAGLLGYNTIEMLSMFKSQLMCVLIYGRAVEKSSLTYECPLRIFTVFRAKRSNS